MEKLDHISSALKKILQTKESKNKEPVEMDQKMNNASIVKNKIRTLGVLTNSV
jgi:hypothetical protein